MPLEVEMVETLEGEGRRVEVDDAALLFFDTFIAALACHLGPNEHLAYFQFEDDEGDRVTVRDDDGLRDMLLLSSAHSPLRIFPVRRNDSDGSSIEVMSGDWSLEEKTSQNQLNPAGLNPASLRHLLILGSGHSGTVYKTLDTVNDRIMAVKSIAMDVSTDMLAAIISETELLRKCRCEFIIEFYAALFVDNHFSMCTEYMDGGSLDVLGHLPSDSLQPVSCCVVRGLSYLWRHRIMHRDVKPSNILVNKKGVVKLCDFGASKRLQHSVAQSYVGTSAYMAPERIFGGEYRIHSDVWSVGLTLLELALGRFPLERGEESVAALMQRIATQSFPVFRPLLSHLHSSFSDLVLSCLMKEPSERGSPSDLLQNVYIADHDPIDFDSVARFVMSAARSDST